LYMAASALGAVTLGTGIWGLGRALSPAASILEPSSLNVDLALIPRGGEQTFKFERKPLAVSHLLPAELA
jgi:hypothetical protein